MLDRNVSKIVKQAWELARRMSKASGGGAKKYFGDALRETYRLYDMENLFPELDYIPYVEGLGNGGDDIGDFVDSTHINGSGSFWLTERDDDDGIDPNNYQNWDDTYTDYTSKEDLLNDIIEALGKSNEYSVQTVDGELRIVNTAVYNSLKNRGYIS